MRKSIPKLVVIAIALVAMIGLAFGCKPSGEVTPPPPPPPTGTIQKTYNLTFAQQMPIGHPLSKTGDFIVERAKELSGGKILITHYPGGTLYSGKEMPEAIMSGAVDCGVWHPGMVTGKIPELSVWDIAPIAPPTPEQNYELMEKLDPIFREICEPFGARFMYHVCYGDVEGIGNIVRPIRQVADFKGLRIRSFSTMLSASMVAVGMVPSVISSDEVYTAMQYGTVDGGWSGLSTHVDRKWMEVEKYLTRIDWVKNFCSLPFNLVFNEKSWEKLEPAAQQVMDQVFKEAWGYSYELGNAEMLNYWEILQKQPNLTCDYIQLGTPVHDEIVNLMLPAGKAEYLKRAGPKGQEILKMFEAYGK